MGRILFRQQSARLLWIRNISRYPEGWLLYLFWLLVGHMSPARASATGRKLFRRLGPKTHKHQRIKRNLRLAFGNLNDDETEGLARGIWENFGAVLAEYPHLAKIRATGASPRIDVVVDSATRPILEERRPAIYVSAHLGNWELVAPTLSAKGIPLSLVYGPQGNPVLDALLQAQRQSCSDSHFIAKANALQQLIRDIRAGRSVGLLPDQRVDTGEAIDFFGLQAPTTTSPAWLAMKLDCPLVPVQVERMGDARYRMTFHTPLLTGCEPANQERLIKTTADLNALFEQWIRQRPEQWLCMKRRWPESTYPAS
ncbi:MAG: lysophospholipid acyltransferase family protein [Gammaproteobacteria bacterium]|nr:MAG: lysophospholipid acyltransferase family protein [Gammaproteobacteria bacterium]